MKQQQTITVYEHQVLKLGDLNNGVRFDLHTLTALQAFHGLKGVPYYSLGYNSVRFNSHVGILQAGAVMIEVLPKADAMGNDAAWREALIGMLLTVQNFDVSAPSRSNLSIKPNSILDLYFQLFINELEHLIRLGLIKTYKPIERNQMAFKGALLIGKDLQHNLVHRERFFTRHHTYDTEHLLHQLLWASLLLIKEHNNSQALQSRIRQVILHFPEQDKLVIRESLFARVKPDRKTAPYQKALSIAKMLLLNYHPDVRQGRSHVLALLFDMNDLWEKFVFKTLSRHLILPGINVSVKGQQRKNFWKPKNGYDAFMKADIILEYQWKGQQQCVILDTKWKNLNGYNPSPEDLRQLYVYHEYYQAHRVALVYPGRTRITDGHYYGPSSKLGDKNCAVLVIGVSTNVGAWQQIIVEQLREWLRVI